MGSRNKESLETFELASLHLHTYELTHIVHLHTYLHMHNGTAVYIRASKFLTEDMILNHYAILPHDQNSVQYVYNF